MKLTTGLNIKKNWIKIKGLIYNGVPNLATCILLMTKPGLGTGINTGMTLKPFAYILDEI